MQPNRCAGYGDAARREALEQHLALGKADARLGDPQLRAVIGHAERHIAHTHHQRLVPRREPLPGEVGAAERELRAGERDECLLPPHQPGEVDRPLRQPPGQHADSHEQQRQHAERCFHQQVDQMGEELQRPGQRRDQA